MKTEEVSTMRAPPPAAPAAAPERIVQPALGRIEGALLMAGGPRPSPLAASTGISTLDLSIDGRRTLLEVWLERLGALGEHWSESGSIRVVYCVRSDRPGAPRFSGSLPLSIEQEEHEFRGTAGLARDVFDGLRPDATVLVIEASRFAGCALEPLVDRHLTTGADITVGMNPDSTPAGVFILRRSTLDLASPRGFMDMKEQWLRAALAADLDVRVCRMEAPGIVLLRTREDFVRTALSSLRLGMPAGRIILDGVAVQRPSVISSDADVSDEAIVADSVVMSGVTVGAGAIVVRSVLCPGAVVAPHSQVIDEIVSGSSQEKP